ncbi:MAG: hypothetical protein KDA86_12805 [Planctomycetaceae bacterium]|nr:hypothetical protein [Planctomycetaceae bacterium]MCA9111228.1 hypothetical protein [Planctomycetaceae bacterium]
MRKPKSSAPCKHDARRGAFVVLAFFCLIGTIAFVSFSIDTGHIALSKTIQQNAVDAAALAAAMEITNAVENAPPDEEDPTAYAREQAKVMAVNVADLNGVFIDPEVDVTFGLRSYNPATEKFEIQWGVTPANSVKVRARRSNPDTSQPDGQLPLMFARIFGDDSVRMESEAIAYIESRDISVVLDFSGSMAYDSLFRSESVNRFGVDAIRDNLRSMYTQMAFTDGQLGTLDHVDPDDSASDRDAETKWLVVHSPETGDPSDPDVDVTFMYDEIAVESSKTYHQIKLVFSNGTSQTFDDNDSSGTYAGTGSHSGKEIDTVWVMFAGGDVTVSGDDANRCKPHIDVTFHGGGTSVYVESTKDLSNVVLEFEDGTHYKFGNLNQGKTGTFEGIGANTGKVIAGVWVKSGCNSSGDGRGYGERFDSPESGQTSVAIRFDDSDENVKAYFGLDDVDYPFPSGSWNDYINYVRNDSEVNRGNHRETYGGITFVHYLLERRPKHSQTPAISKASHFPFHAVREGNDLFVDFLANLGFGDHVGLVSYDQERRIESVLNEDGQSIDISADPLDANYDAIKTIMSYKQANNYYPYTNIGGGIRQAIDMIDDFSRDGSRPTILLMTDGNANTYDNEDGDNSRDYGFDEDDYWDVPDDFDWGVFNNLDTTSTVPFYVSSSGSDNKARRYALSQAFKAAKEGYTLHTLAVGAGADTDLMKAIAFLGGGEYIEVQGTLTVEDLLEQVEAGFYRIAALVPPAKLADPDEAE